ncbi:MAG TPA: FAD-dependent oxidoreductase, partial [Verrucomicrobiae bacterium]|nr:FAD-dependent oxidoreductase [Verrucomicrobiae bacterium]
TWLPKPGAARTAQRTSDPAIAIAGSWTDTGWPDTMESAIRSARTAAGLIAGNRRRDGIPPVVPSAAPDGRVVEGQAAQVS